MHMRAPLFLALILDGCTTPSVPRARTPAGGAPGADTALAVVSPDSATPPGGGEAGAGGVPSATPDAAPVAGDAASPDAASTPVGPAGPCKHVLCEDFE